MCVCVCARVCVCVRARAHVSCALQILQARTEQPSVTVHSNCDGATVVDDSDDYNDCDGSDVDGAWS